MGTRAAEVIGELKGGRLEGRFLFNEVKLRIYLLVLLCLLTSPVFAADLKMGRSCRLEDGSQALLLSKDTLDGKQLSLRVDQRLEAAFSDMPDVNFVGEVVLARCIHGALISALNYGSPYIKGAVIRKRLGAMAIDRINFAEKALPRWLYLGRSDMRLVVPNIGYEVSSRFLVYEFSARGGQQLEVIGSDRKPDEHDFRVSRVK